MTLATLFFWDDGTVVKTGVFNGVIRRHELKLHRTSHGLSAYLILTSCRYDTYLSASLLVPRLTPETLDSHFLEISWGNMSQMYSRLRLFQ
ncbi:hypothetical protein AVEN_204575-1 [Araneus ventricosus]|uniref:Uncharacterized protein n=1 Tax=Araneus ventricosus TaxID=182803 RepID=A0A4Y2IH19_ARAVE|nr:hypothetical protein AVEN_204575-1 [Araneus ventricosus]